MSKYFLFGWLMIAPCYAIDTHHFANASQQASYDELTNELRCLVCQNQTIADSNADLASDLREQIFVMLEQGKSKEAIVQFMTDRYGDFVLYKPPFKTTTLLLWLGPVVFFVLGMIVIIVLTRRQNSRSLPDEQKLKQARSLLNKGKNH